MIRAALLIAAITLLSSTAEAPRKINANPTPEEARAFAAQVGKKPKCDTTVGWSAKFSWDKRSLHVSTPLCRLEQEVIRARIAFDTFEVNEESLASLRPGILMTVSMPSESGGGVLSKSDRAGVLSAHDIIVLRSRSSKGDDVVKPAERVLLDPVTYSNLFGASFDYSAWAFYFDLADLATVQNEKGEFDIVGRNSDGSDETVFSVKEGQLKKLF